MLVDLAALAPRLDLLIRRLATNHDGERLATVAAMQRVLVTADASFHDLADVLNAAHARAATDETLDDIEKSVSASPGRPR